MRCNKDTDQTSLMPAVRLMLVGCVSYVWRRQRRVQPVEDGRHKTCSGYTLLDHIDISRRWQSIATWIAAKVDRISNTINFGLCSRTGLCAELARKVSAFVRSSAICLYLGLLLKEELATRHSHAGGVERRQPVPLKVNQRSC